MRNVGTMLSQIYVTLSSFSNHILFNFLKKFYDLHYGLARSGLESWIVLLIYNSLLLIFLTPWECIHSLLRWIDLLAVSVLCVRAENTSYRHSTINLLWWRCKSLLLECLWLQFWFSIPCSSLSYDKHFTELKILSRNTLSNTYWINLLINSFVSIFTSCTIYTFLRLCAIIEQKRALEMEV